MDDVDAKRLADRRRRGARWFGGATALIIIAVMAAGADKPPPPGFVVVIIVGVGLGILTAVLIPGAMVKWDQRGARPTLGRWALGGCVVAAVLWTLASVFSSADPAVGMSAASRLIGFVVVTVVGALGATVAVAAARLFDQRARR